MRKNEKEKAIALRKQGYSYNEICAKLNVAKSTCSLWLRGIKLDKEAIHRLVERQDEGRKRAALTLRQYGKERDDFIRKQVDETLKDFTLTLQIGKLICASLYWGEGAKRSKGLNFTNSDPNMVKVYLALLRKYFTLEDKKLHALLHLHSYHKVKMQKKFWSKVTGIPIEKISIYKKPNSGKNIREGYPGCISIRYYDIRLAKEVEFLYNSLVSRFGGVV